MSKNKELYITPDQRFAFDPLSLRRRLLILTDNKLNDLIAVHSGSENEVERLKVEDQLIAVTRQAFGLNPLGTENGVADETVMEYLAHFLEWLSLPSQPKPVAPQIDVPCMDCLSPK